MYLYIYVIHVLHMCVCAVCPLSYVGEEPASSRCISSRRREPEIDARQAFGLRTPDFRSCENPGGSESWAGKTWGPPCRGKSTPHLTTGSPLGSTPRLTSRRGAKSGHAGGRGAARRHAADERAKRELYLYCIPILIRTHIHTHTHIHFNSIFLHSSTSHPFVPAHLRSYPLEAPGRGAANICTYVYIYIYI